MYTTDPHGGAGTTPGKQHRLAQLLLRRDRLGATWAEHASHGIEDLGGLTEDLIVVEMALADQWPHAFNEWIEQWIAADAAKLHDPDASRRLDCSICATLAGRATAA